MSHQYFKQKFCKFKAFEAYARARGLTVRRLRSDPEDHLEHYYAGDDQWYFDQSGGELLPENGYFCLDTSANPGETYGEFCVLQGVNL